MPTRLEPVSITGMGVLSPAGTGIDPLWAAVVEGRSLIEPGTGLARIPDSARTERAPSGAESRPLDLAWLAAREAIRAAGWGEPGGRKPPLGEQDGLIVATTVGQIPLWHEALVAFAQDKCPEDRFLTAFVHQPLGSMAEALSRALGFQGTSLLVSSACSAATQALALASSWVRSGRVRRCLVGGIEVLTPLTVEGFRCLQLLSQEASRPFDRNRSGINLSEASAFFCVERAGAPGEIARLCGHGLSTDAFHMASPHPEGRGSFQAMRAALDRAGLRPADISYVHAHGTGSRANDEAEGLAIAQLFGRPDSATPPPVCSTKRIHGHALGASGALEAAICIRSLQEGYIPATAGLVEPDPAIPARHSGTGRSAKVRHILKSTLGFGGNNAALVLSSTDDRSEP